MNNNRVDSLFSLLEDYLKYKSRRSGIYWLTSVTQLPDNGSPVIVTTALDCSAYVPHLTLPRKLITREV